MLKTVGKLTLVETYNISSLPGHIFWINANSTFLSIGNKIGKVLEIYSSNIYLICYDTAFP